jgi:hypoxanthine phosphoribosyltransferase
MASKTPDFQADSAGEIFPAARRPETIPASHRQTASRGSPPQFVNQAELECARILDFHGLRWEYEPRSFVLEEDDEGRVLEAFTPDFYLPEQDLYLEVTVMKQSLVTRKNRKIRKLRERYPDVKIKLFTRRDFDRLAHKYRLDLV